MVCSALRSGAFFSVVPKSLAVVTSERVWDVYFNFCYCISYFYFGTRFWGVETANTYVFVWIIL